MLNNPTNISFTIKFLILMLSDGEKTLVAETLYCWWFGVSFVCHVHIGGNPFGFGFSSFHGKLGFSISRWFRVAEKWRRKMNQDKTRHYWKHTCNCT